MLWAFRTCVDTLDPVAVREPVQFTDKHWVVIEALLLPIGKTDQIVDIVFGGVAVVGSDAELPPQGTSYILDWSLG